MTDTPQQWWKTPSRNSEQTLHKSHVTPHNDAQWQWDSTHWYTMAMRLHTLTHHGNETPHINIPWQWHSRHGHTMAIRLHTLKHHGNEAPHIDTPWQWDSHTLTHHGNDTPHIDTTWQWDSTHGHTMAMRLHTLKNHGNDTPHWHTMATRLHTMAMRLHTWTHQGNETPHIDTPWQWHSTQWHIRAMTLHTMTHQGNERHQEKETHHTWVETDINTRAIMHHGDDKHCGSERGHWHLHWWKLPGRAQNSVLTLGHPRDECKLRSAQTPSIAKHGLHSVVCHPMCGTQSCGL